LSYLRPVIVLFIVNLLCKPVIACLAVLIDLLIKPVDDSPPESSKPLTPSIRCPLKLPLHLKGRPLSANQPFLLFQKKKQALQKNTS
jgi:hypothetical protein